MKLVSYKTEDREHLGVFFNGHIYNLNSLNHVIPDNMNEFLWGGDALMEAAHRVHQDLKSGSVKALSFTLFLPSSSSNTFTKPKNLFVPLH